MNDPIKKDSFLDDWLKKRDEIRSSNSNSNIQQNQPEAPSKSNLARTFQKNIMQNQSASSYNANNSNNPQVQQNIKPQQIQNDSVIQDIRTTRISNNLSNNSSNAAKNNYKKVDNGEVIFKIR